MIEKGIKQLPPFLKWRFIPKDSDMYDKEQVAGLYRLLRDRPVQTRQDFEQFLLDRSELDAAVDQNGAILYIRMTSQTDNASFAEAYQEFIKEIIPVTKILSHELDMKILDLVKKLGLPQPKYELYVRHVQADVDIFRTENISISTKLKLLSQKYQVASGGMTVMFEGEDQTLSRMSRYLLEKDRVIRQKAWLTMGNRRIAEQALLDGIFNEMVMLRDSLAKQTGFHNFRDFCFKKYHRFDYGPEECRSFHEAIEDHVVPIWAKILERRRAMLGVDILKPWDLEVDPYGEKPLKPFDRVDQLVDAVIRIFTKIDTHLGAQFVQIRDWGLLDLENRKSKAPGGYQSFLADMRKPFIFMNAVGLDRDVRTLLHEGGHAFHSMACVHEPLFVYRYAPMEFCEVASMTMELLAEDFLNEIYTPDEIRRSCQRHWEDIVFTFIWVAVIDAFQHWVYEYPHHTVTQRQEKWVEIYNRFNPSVLCWDGLDKYLRIFWHKQLHVFEVPFYYIEYGIAQIGAIQIWQDAVRDFKKTIERYKKALSFGGACSLPDLFRSAGLNFEFSEGIIKRLMEAVKMRLELN